MSAVSPFHPAHGHPLDGTAWLEAVAAELARSPELWADRVRHVPGTRCYEAIEVGGAEAWVITWAPGTGLALHDHGGAAGALTVVAGRLHERYGRRELPGVLRNRTLEVGPVLSFDADHVHQVTNLGSEPAVSIHVYAPSLEAMTFYGDDPRDDQLVPAASTRDQR